MIVCSYPILKDFNRPERFKIHIRSVVSRKKIRYQTCKKKFGKNLNFSSFSLFSKQSSVPDPKLIISDPDPQIKNHEFRIRIRIQDPDPSVN